METGDGARLAQLLLETFEAMVDEVLVELGRSGHAGLTVANEFALQAVDAGATSAAALARALGVTRQAAAKTIATLEGLGYVERGSDAADARVKGLQLTAEARDAISIGSAAFDRVRERWIASVGATRVVAAERALHDLRDGLRRDGARG